jgi:selenocysteine lyase/cysteine desulfurase
VIDYFDALHHQHFGSTDANQSQKMADIHPLIQAHENSITQPILSYLDGHAKVKLIGKSHVNDNDRAPTIAFKPLKQSSAALASSLQKAGIGTENGNFYAHRLISDLGFDTEDGVVRISLLHYDRNQEVERILLELDRALG